MTPLWDTLFRAGGKIETALARFRGGLVRFFLSNREAARRASEKFDALQRKALEAERIDRLRNPGNYQGK